MQSTFTKCGPVNMSNCNSVLNNKKSTTSLLIKCRNIEVLIQFQNSYYLKGGDVENQKLFFVLHDTKDGPAYKSRRNAKYFFGKF